MAHYGGSVAGACLATLIAGDLQESLAHQWFSQFLERSCRLIRMPEDSQRMSRSQSGDRTARTSLSDDYPILMTSESSLADLNGRMAEPVGMERFRPNLVVAGECLRGRTPGDICAWGKRSSISLSPVDAA
ncbi:MAG: MOSC domain-containing protein [Myxococcota bacterium]